MPISSKTRGVRQVLALAFWQNLLFLSGFLVWLTPLPLLYAFKRGRWKLACGAAFVALGSLALLYGVLLPQAVFHWGLKQAEQFLFWVPGMAYYQGGPLEPLRYGLSYFVFYGTIGLLLGRWEGSTRDPAQLVGKVLGVLALMLIALLVWQVGWKWGHVFRGFEDFLSELLEQMKHTFRGEGAGPDQAVFLERYGEAVIYYAVRLLPSFLLCTGIFVVWLNMVVARRVFSKEGLFASMTPMVEWQAPFVFVWVLIALVGLMLLDVYGLHWGGFKILTLNALMVFGMVYFFQGLAIFAYYGERWAISSLIRLLFYFLFLVFIQPLSMLLMALGFFDSWFDFRKLAVNGPRR